MSRSLALQELQDIVERLGEGLGEVKPVAEPPVDDSCAEASAILAQAHVLRGMLRKLGPKAPACFTDRIVAAALDLDPVPDPAAIHRLDD